MKVVREGTKVIIEYDTETDAKACEKQIGFFQNHPGVIKKALNRRR